MMILVAGLPRVMQLVGRGAPRDESGPGVAHVMDLVMWGPPHDGSGREGSPT